MRKVYFGNAVKQVWIPAPQSGLKADSSGKFYQNELLNGRTSISRSGANSRRFSTSWLGSLNAPEIEDSLHTIKDFYDGIYGEGPFYWNDPYAVKSNILPPHWAAPMLSYGEWPSITSIGLSTVIETSDNTKNYPYQMLAVTSEGGLAESSQSLRIIIPEGYRLHFGWHGARESTGMTVVLRAYERATGDTVDFETTELSMTTSVRTNKSVSGTTYSMVDIFIADTTGDGGILAIAGMIAQILPESAFPEQGDFISGRGTAGMEFAAPVSIEYYSANINDGQVALSTEWQEI